jgi:hypothetical protein
MMVLVLQLVKNAMEFLIVLMELMNLTVCIVKIRKKN